MNIDEKLEESIENKYMKNDKDKNKMELTIEESVYILKRKDFNMYVENRAIETLLTAYEKEKEKNKELEKMLNLKSHKRRYNTMNYIKKNKLNKFDTVGICQDMRAFKRTGEIKYRAYITFQNKQYTLGTYTSLDKAKEARKKGEIMVENIKKNFVEKIKEEE